MILNEKKRFFFLKFRSCLSESSLGFYMQLQIKLIHIITDTRLLGIEQIKL